MTTRPYFLRRLRSAAYTRDGIIVKVPVVWLLENIKESCDWGDMETASDWEGLISSKASDDGFGYLVESIMDKGMMRRGAIGFKLYKEGGYINEGHHRLVAAILLGLDHVYVRAWGTSHYSDQKLPQLSAHGDYGRKPYPIYL